MSTIRTAIDVELPPADALHLFLADLARSLAADGIRFEARPGGEVVQGGQRIGEVTAWEEGTRVVLAWQPADWAPRARTEIEIRAEPAPGGALLTLEHSGWGGLFADQGAELLAWFTRAAAPLLSTAAPAALGDWLTDRHVRRPSGPTARATYGDPLYHRPNFRAILSALALTPEDHLLEVGCGGGAFLQEALAGGCTAAAIDHSWDMVRLAREQNAPAIEAGRLQIEEGSADALPFPDDTFTCAVMTGVLATLPDPITALSEIRRVLRPGGRLVLFTSSEELRGTPAAPEPFAARLHFYTDEELADMARAAGLTDITVDRIDLSPFAREAGSPEEVVPLFKGSAGQLLLAWRGQ